MKKKSNLRAEVDGLADGDYSRMVMPRDARL
jgi:hypothetical protein